jgi:hypothetical protein
VSLNPKLRFRINTSRCCYAIAHCNANKAEGLCAWPLDSLRVGPHQKLRLKLRLLYIPKICPDQQAARFSPRSRVHSHYTRRLGHLFSPMDPFSTVTSVFSGLVGKKRAQTPLSTCLFHRAFLLAESLGKALWYKDKVLWSFLHLNPILFCTMANFVLFFCR